MTLWHLIHDLRCGLHSEIPACCIAWFIGPWQVILSQPGLYRLWDEFIPKGFGRVACPICLLRDNRFPLRDCKCMDGDILARILLDLDWNTQMKNEAP